MWGEKRRDEDCGMGWGVDNLKISVCSLLKKIEAFKRRTKLLSLRIIKLFQALPKTDEARIIGKQLLHAATSVAANYRAGCRSRSDAEFFS